VPLTLCCGIPQVLQRERDAAVADAAELRRAVAEYDSERAAAAAERERERSSMCVFKHNRLCKCCVYPSLARVVAMVMGPARWLVVIGHSVCGQSAAGLKSLSSSTCVPRRSPHHRRRMPRTPKRGGGSFLPDANGHASAAGGSKPHDSDLLSNTDILYLKNVVLKFIQVCIL